MSITKLSRQYISDHPSIKDCLRLGLVNYSALARTICDNLQIKQFDAVVVAARRYYDQIKSQLPHEKKIVSLIRNAKLRAHNKIAVAVVEKPRDFERLYTLQKKIKKDRGDFNFIEGEDALVLVTNSDYLDDLRVTFKGRIIKLSENLAQITMLFDQKIETTSGVVAYVYGLLASNGINVLEEMSCWTDLMLVVAEQDAAKAMRVLSFGGKYE